MADLPLIRNFREDGVFAYCNGKPIGTAQFLQHVRQLASQLPSAAHVLNLCADRYHFSVALAAALVRSQVSS